MTGAIGSRILGGVVVMALAVGLPGRSETQPGGLGQQEPFARTRLDPGTRVTVGQPLTVTVDVLVPTWFARAPRFPDVEVANALVLFVDRGTNLSERIDGATWSGQSRSYTIYPQRAGRVTIDQIPVALRYAVPGGSPLDAIVSPPPIEFEAVRPPGTEGLRYFISTERLTLEQSFDTTPDTLRTGDAFVRTITVTVRKALSMVLPPLMFDAPGGIRTYVDPPRVTDSGGVRGEEVVGTRVESATYVAETPGTYRLEAIEIVWWDVAAERLQRETLPPVEFHVLAASVANSVFPLPPDDLAEAGVDSDASRLSWRGLLRRWGVPVVLALMIVFFAARIVRRWLPRWRAASIQARHRRDNSEAAFFGRFLSAARAGDAAEAWARLTRWLDVVAGGPDRAATVRGFVHDTEDSALQDALAELEERLFGRRAGGVTGSWLGREFAQLIAQHRNARRRAVDLAAGIDAPLPALQPHGEAPSEA